MKKAETVRVHAGMTVIGGFGYNLIEILWRGRTHWSMFLLGGVCFEVIALVHDRLRRLPLLARGAVCAAAVTALELLSGCILNLGLGLEVWDYSRMKGNFKGQICPLYSFFWLILSMAACPLCRGCRRLLTHRARE